jgi:YggT family protein
VPFAAKLGIHWPPRALMARAWVSGWKDRRMDRLSVSLLATVLFAFDLVISLLIWLLVANAVLSWLVAFDVINLRNRIVSQIYRFLDAVTRPILRPIQRVIPPLGNVDISPVVVLLILLVIRFFVHSLI